MAGVEGVKVLKKKSQLIEKFLVNEKYLEYQFMGENPNGKIICTINRLIYYFLLIKWINFEVWWLIGDGPYTMNH